ncbi:MAG: M23 family metallopeptidase [Spirochaetaceae bacterium]|jgi:murein DD-endopeptidase MepM/ murein hydrolase activator NlpD|nr:M23 family metallopeptidase [Spirochaetaceae bacterium]
MRINITAGKPARFRAGVLLAFAGTVFFCGQLFADDDTIRVVKSGDTIYGLAREYGVKVEEILFINGIEDARKVQSGQSIRIPSRSTMAPPINSDTNAPAVVSRRVQKGETLFGISRQYGVTIQNIRDANNLSDGYVLKTNDVLKIPVVAKSATSAPPSATTIMTTMPAETSGAAKTDNPSASAREVNLSLVWPVNPKQAAYMTGKLSGVEMIGEKGEGVYCVFPGTVISAGPYRGFGRVVIVKSVEDYMYVYGGCETLSVKAGDSVTAGTELGRLGIDAVSGQAALFFMVYLNNNPIDPAAAPRD